MMGRRLENGKSMMEDGGSRIGGGERRIERCKFESVKWELGFGRDWFGLFFLLPE
jgi:hypothetical protein